MPAVGGSLTCVLCFSTELYLVFFFWTLVFGHLSWANITLLRIGALFGKQFSVYMVW